MPDRCVFHCFSGGPAEAERCLSLGATLSFSGIVTFPSAGELREAASRCPLRQMLVETDSPYLTPVPHRGKRNEPAYVPLVGEAIARLRGVPAEEVAAATSANAAAIFGLPRLAVRRPPGRAEVVALLGDHGLRPSRALGQNFVVDPNLVERIARLAGIGPGDRVLEVGAGLGSLTLALAATGAHVLAIEIDRHLEPLLRAIAEPSGVTVVRADAMTCDLPAMLAEAEHEWAPAEGGERRDDDRPWVLVANLPYNIATPLVMDLLGAVPAIGRMQVMVQREVGERLAAVPPSPAVGAVSIRLAYFATARVVMRVPAKVFLPEPNVDSVLVEIVRRDRPAVDPAEASFEEIDLLVRAGFAGRRKMLRRSLAGLVTPEAFEAAGVVPTARPEELDVEAWGRLAAAARSERAKASASDVTLPGGCGCSRRGLVLPPAPRRWLERASRGRARHGGGGSQVDPEPAGRRRPPGRLPPARGRDGDGQPLRPARDRRRR